MADGSSLPMSDEAIKRGSGKGWEEWFAILDAWGAVEQNHTEIARYVVEEHGVGGWHAQSVTVGYERARGLRQLNETTTGFSASASKTVAAPVGLLYRAFVDSELRDRWLEAGTLELRTAQEDRSARFDIAGGILELWLTDKGPNKASVQLQQGKLPDQAAVEAWRGFWKARLTRLAALLAEEHGRGAEKAG